MSNKVGHEGAQLNQPSSPTSQDLNQHRRQRGEPDSNQSNQRRRTDDQTSATENNNNSFVSSMSQENLERLRQHAYLQMDRQMEEDAIHDSDDDYE
ncbi:hypothetical protein MKX01_040030 [Papaver californicum]|nr:hypothetical protein MKX01_040030 [Papaver californicum]